MSDMWDKEYPQQSPATPVEPEVSAVPEAPAAPMEPTAPVPVAPVAPVQPQTPPTNGFSPESRYHYVPPRSSAQEHYYQPATPVPASTRTKEGGRGWIAVVAVLSALAIFVSGAALIYALWKDAHPAPTDKSDKITTNDVTVGDKDDKDDKKPVDGDQDADDEDKKPNENAPSVDQKPGNQPDDFDPDKDYYYGDGGLSAESIVNRNYDSTVILTMYMESGYHYFGESSLQEVGAASGIVWTADGYIITNCHCVLDEDTGEEFDRIDVTLYDGTVYEDAEIIGADEATDLAVIKVDATDLVPAEFGDSDDLAVGSRVVALGNAIGLSWTATQGIVSAKARDVYEDTGYAIKCLQVDAAINSGNSGGPLLNKYGQVVGINSAKIVASGVEGLGFSIPINEAKVVLESLAKYGYVKGRVALGITGNTIDNGYYQGFMIVDILDGSCLKGTEAEEGDLIVAVDDVTVVDYGTLRAELAQHKIGDTITLKLLRSNRRTGEVTSLEVDVILKEQTAD